MQKKERESVIEPTKKKRGQQPKLSPEQAQELADRFFAGQMLKELAVSFDVCSQTARATLRRAGFSNYQIHMQLHRRKREPSPLFKSERNLDIARMKADGCSYQEIADKHGISRQRVGQILYDNGYANPTLVNARADKLYRYLLEYKAENDGNTPVVNEMLRHMGETYNRLMTQLYVLVERGLIAIQKRETKNVHVSHILIVGATWTPPPPVKHHDK